MSLLFGGCRLLSCCCFSIPNMFKKLYITDTLLTVPPVCAELTSAMCSLLLAGYEQTVPQCIDDGGCSRKRGWGRILVCWSSTELLLYSPIQTSVCHLEDSKNYSPGRETKLWLCSAGVPGHIWSSFVPQAHSWAFSSPCPKPRTSIHPAGISKTTLSCFWLQPWMTCLVEQSSLCRLACRSLGSGSVLLLCMSSQN